MNWLTAHLAALPPGTRKLLFYHYDFGGTLGNGSPGANFSQINPAALGVDGVIWGHNHGVAEGNRTAKPFNLGLQAVIDGLRSFRIFRYSNGVITPGPMHHAGTALDSLSQSWNRNNDGTADDITTTIINRYGESWPRARQVFHKNPGWPTYVATNGTVVQEIEHDGMHDVYVEFNLPASSNLQVRVEGTYPLDVPREELAQGVVLRAPVPNPIAQGGTAAIAFTLPAPADGVDLGVFDVAGRRIATLASGSLAAGPHHVSWTADGVAGVCFLRLSALGGVRVAKLVVTR
jgi:hypothetical protein